jgi:hypothetical protein
MMKTKCWKGGLSQHDVKSHTPSLKYQCDERVWMRSARHRRPLVGVTVADFIVVFVEVDHWSAQIAFLIGGLVQHLQTDVVSIAGIASRSPHSLSSKLDRGFLALPDRA